MQGPGGYCTVSKPDTTQSHQDFGEKLRQDVLFSVSQRSKEVLDRTAQFEHRIVSLVEKHAAEVTKRLSDLQELLEKRPLLKSSFASSEKLSASSLSLESMKSESPKVVKPSLSSPSNGASPTNSSPARTLQGELRSDASEARLADAFHVGTDATAKPSTKNRLGSGLGSGLNGLVHLTTDKAQSRTGRFMAMFTKQGGIAGKKELTPMEKFERHWIFRNLVTLVIFASTALLGIEADTDMKLALAEPPGEMPAAFETVNSCVAVFFAFELLVRIMSQQVHFLLGPDLGWNLLDTFLVTMQILEMVLTASNSIRFLKVVRILRLARTLRILRFFRVFRSLRVMVVCVLGSLGSLFWALMLLGLVTYIFSIFCLHGTTQFIRGDYLQLGVLSGLQRFGTLAADSPDFVEPSPEELESGIATDYLGSAEFRRQIVLHFRSLIRTLLSLLMCTTGGMDWYEVTRIMLAMHPVYVACFVAYVCFIIFGVCNVMSAVFVNNALEVTDRDLIIQREMSRTDDFFSDMLVLFEEGDTDASGAMSKDELGAYLSNQRVMAYLSYHNLDVADVEGIFDLLDEDKSGKIEVSEFLLGTFRLKGNSRSLELFKLFRCMEQIEDQLANITDVIGLGSRVGTAAAFARQQTTAFRTNHLAVAPSRSTLSEMLGGER